MRRVTRNLLIAIGVVVLALLALGALPSHLETGDPYHLTVEPTDDEGTAVDVSDVSERRFPYLTSALVADDGRSDAYYDGPIGVKEHFTHTPFDEMGALLQREPAAIDEDDRVRIVYEGERYYVEIVHEAV